MTIWSSEIKELETLYHSLKGKFPDLEKELIQLIETKDANVALLYSRRSLEVIITDVCERDLKRPRGTEPLKGIIDKLNREGKVPHNIIVSMQNLNSLSTFGTHPKDFEPRQVKPVLLDLTTVLEWYLKYMEDQELVIGKSGVVQEKRKEPGSLLRSKSKSAKRVIMVTSVLLVAAIIIVSLIVFNIIGVGKRARAGSIESIVILPFGNYTGTDTLDPYISGMHSSLINELGKIKGLRIISKVSSDSYKNSDKSIPQIAKELKVDAAIELGVLCFSDTICMQPRLMSGDHEERQLWVGDYREAKGNLFNLYNQIIRQIAGEVKISLTPKEKAMLAESRSIDREAIDAYLKGNSFAGDMSPESLLKARDYLNSAIDKDPDWAPLYAALARVWLPLGGFGIEPLEIAYSKAYENAKKAIELDPDLADAHYINAWLAATEEWNMEKAENEFIKALANNPNHTLSRMHYSWLLYALHRPEEAKVQADLAIKLDPMNPLMQCFYGVALCDGGDCASALAVLENVVTSDPNNWYANNIIESAAFLCGDLNRVFEAEKHILPLEEGIMNEIEKIYNNRGFHAALEEIMRHLEILAEKGYVTPIAMAWRYYVLNQDDKVMEWIEKAVEVRDADLWGLGTKFANFTRLYDNPRFIEVLKKMNLPLPKSD